MTTATMIEASAPYATNSKWRDYLCDTHALEKAGSFPLRLCGVGGEGIRTRGNLVFAARCRFGGLLDRLLLQGNAGGIFGGSLDALGNGVAAALCLSIAGAIEMAASESA